MRFVSFENQGKPTYGLWQDEGSWLQVPAGFEARYPDLMDPKSPYQSADAYVIAQAQITGGIVVFHSCKPVSSFFSPLPPFFFVLVFRPCAATTCNAAAPSLGHIANQRTRAVYPHLHPLEFLLVHIWVGLVGTRLHCWNHSRLILSSSTSSFFR